MHIACLPENLYRINDFGDLSMCGSIILKWIVKKWTASVWTGSGQRPLAGSFEYDIEPSGSMNDTEFENLSDYHILRKDSATRNSLKVTA